MEKEKTRFLKRNDGTIYDSLSSLIWMADDSQISLGKEVGWDKAKKFAEETNKKKFAGHNDWRMPTLHEALSLFDKDKLNKDSAGADIHIDSVFTPGGANCSWTSETRGKEAQIVFYVNGYAYWYNKNDKTISHAVRLVRRD